MAHTDVSLTNLLNKIAEEQNYKNPDITINEISSGGANYTSKLFTVVLRAQNKEDLHLFAKVAVMSEKMRTEASASNTPINIFDTEKFAYTKLWKIYSALEDKNGVPEEHRLLYTKCYGFDDTVYQEKLVLENLLTQGYGPFDRFKSVDWAYASAAISECAKLHALSFAFRKENPDEFQKFLDMTKMDWADMKMGPTLDNCVKSALKLIKPQNKQAFENMLKNPLDMMVKLYTPVRTNAIIHGDFRGNNLLHRVREDGKVDIKVLDLQTLQAGSPATDVVYFIIAGTDEQFRAQYYDKLIEHYYSELSASLRRLHLNPDEVYSREDFDYELKEKLACGLVLATFHLAVVLVDEEKAPQVDENLRVDSFNVENNSDLYSERLNGIVNDYVKWGILK
nr:uncharacterized protein LOC126053426 [Helicoverpa armigera]